MNEEQLLAVEQSFFDALVQGDYLALDRVLSDDFVLIDVLSGSEIQKPILVDIVTSGTLKFTNVERIDATVRFFGATGVVTGQTRMEGLYQGAPFSSHSRYTHLFFMTDGVWQLVSAQGTPIGDAAPN